METKTMTTENTDDLAKAMAARLNHDYVSPLTAISNAIEIMKLDESQRELSFQLIEESCGNALRELQFNRVAYGTFGSDERLTINEVNRRLGEYFELEGFLLDTSGIKEPPLKLEVKLWFLTILCLRSSFLTLEKLSIQNISEGWKITCAGTGMVDRNGDFRAESHWLQVADVIPSMVHFPLFFAHAENTGYDVLTKRNDDMEMVVNLWRGE